MFVCLSVCLSPKCKIARFSQKLSNLEPWCLLTTYRKPYIGFSKKLLLDLKIQDVGNTPSWILTSKCKKTQFSQKLRDLELWSLLTTYGNRTWAFQRTHYWTLKIQGGGDTPSWMLTPICKNTIFWKTKQFRAMIVE